MDETQPNARLYRVVCWFLKFVSLSVVCHVLYSAPVKSVLPSEWREINYCLIFASNINQSNCENSHIWAHTVWTSALGSSGKDGVRGGGHSQGSCWVEQRIYTLYVEGGSLDPTEALYCGFGEGFIMLTYKFYNTNVWIPKLNGI